MARNQKLTFRGGGTNEGQEARGEIVIPRRGTRSGPQRRCTNGQDGRFTEKKAPAPTGGLVAAVGGGARPTTPTAMKREDEAGDLTEKRARRGKTKKTAIIPFLKEFGHEKSMGLLKVLYPFPSITERRVGALAFSEGTCRLSPKRRGSSLILGKV